jgi:hypothetical protein
LGANGFKCRRIGFIPAKADAAKQKEFIDGTLDPLFEKAKKGDIALYFMDASHFVQDSCPARAWSRAGLFVKPSSGRKRCNVLGALNFAAKKLACISNEAYIMSSLTAP